MKPDCLRPMFAAWLCVAAGVVRADIVVITNLDNPVQALTARQVSDLFLGRTRTFPGGAGTLILEQPRQAHTREEFFRRLNGMNLKQLNAYWARLQFSGEVQPPAQLEDNAAVLAGVRKNTAAIGYVDSSAVDTSVRVVLRLKE
ncbi:MAG: hypothetical protein V4463_04985 [Pseudomonadota bacterium]